MSCPRCKEGLVNSYGEEIKGFSFTGHTHDYFIEHLDCRDCDHYWTAILSASICWCGWKPEDISNTLQSPKNDGDQCTTTDGNSTTRTG
jgi:hypothetical protein